LTLSWNPLHVFTHTRARTHTHTHTHSLDSVIYDWN